ncbi:hypothetical protein scyTo_0002215 [Scyliorhinus torazame]|uniref:BTB domain-containing protein n=1 Tax=Scyliorhinus torazame TaxID=75743 RepID=A0A401PIC0_SCYTO|nr:hypothetical protein [Scyliorhinus torazame]
MDETDNRLQGGSATPQACGWKVRQLAPFGQPRPGWAPPPVREQDAATRLAMSAGEDGTSYFLALCPSHGESVLAQYQGLRDDRLLCDVVLVAEGAEFRAHRSLLACASDYFRSMFKDHTRESRQSVVHLHTVSASGLRHVLDFIYTSCLALSPESLPQTLETAAYLQVLEAVSLCSRYLVSSLSPGSCCQAANLAARFALAEARGRAEGYIAANLWRLLAADSGLLELNAESLAAVLESERLPLLREEALLDLLLAWLEREAGRWEREAAGLLPRLRYCLLPGAALQRLAAHPRLLGPGLGQVQQLVCQALDYHRAESRQPALQSPQSRLRVGGEGRLLLAGGVLLRQGAVQSLWALDPASRQWSPLGGGGPGVQHHCVCVLANFLFVLGGEEAGAAELEDCKAARPAIRRQVDRYDPRFDRWSRLASMRCRRAQFSCCVLDGCLFALGGRCGLGASLAAVELYDPGSGRWDAVRSLPVKLHGHASAVHADTIYVSGGRAGGLAEAGDTGKDMFSFHPAEGQWKSCPPMAIARFGHQMATVGDRIFSFVGMYEPFCDIECYEPLRRQWQRLRPLLLDRSCYGLAVWGSGIYLVGGKKWRNSQEVAAQDAVLYDTATDSWTEVCKLPLPFCGSQCAVLQLPDLPPDTGQGHGQLHR